jgi:ribonucleoside-diphosphate reductase alpha chain
MKLDYRKLKDEWKQKGEIPSWYSTNALQFFMDKYSYQGETVRSRDTAVAKYLAKHAPSVYPDWWEEDEYTQGKTYEQAFFDVIWEGFAVLSTPLKANAGLPQRGLTVSCCGQHMGNSVASKAFIRGELEVLIKNSHGCSMSVSDWLAEGTVYDKDGNISAGIEPVIDDMQKSTFEINQGIRRGQTQFGVNILHGDFDKIANKLFAESDSLNISWLIGDDFIGRLQNGDKEAIRRFGRVVQVRMQTGKGYFTKIDTMNRNKAQVFKDLGLKVHASNLCNEVNLPANDEYSFTCVIINANLALYEEFPEHLYHILHIMQDCNVSGYIEEIEKKTGESRVFLSKVLKFTKDFRAVGTGVCGFHSLLMKKRIVFGSFDSMILNEEIFKKMRNDLDECNAWLAEVLGEPDKLKGYGKRNATVMMMPPTKSSAELAKESPTESINPETALVRVKETVGGDIFRINTELLKVMKELGQYTQENINFIAQSKGSVQKCHWMPQHLKDVFRNAFETPMEAHLDLCAQRQPYIDQQQSINLYLSGSDTPEYIGNIHKKALLDDNVNGLYYCYSSRGGNYERFGCEMCE